MRRLRLKRANREGRGGPMKNVAKAKASGSVGDILTMGVFVLAMAVVMVAFLNCIDLVQQKTAVRGILREYLLRMETVGYLMPADETELLQELSGAGVTQIRLGNTSRSRVGFGQEITLEISGRLEEIYEIREICHSTAKY